MTQSASNIVTALKLQKRQKDRVNVFLDGEYAFALSLALAASLRRGEQLGDADIARLKAEDELIRAYNQAVRYLGNRPRSQAEIERHLRGKEYAPAAVETAVARLQREGFLDDAEFARYWIENRNRFRPRGARALRFELQQKGVRREIVDSLLEDLDAETLAWAAVEGKLSSWRRLERQELRQKLTGYLARRGFDYAVIEGIFRRAWATMEQEDEL